MKTPRDVIRLTNTFSLSYQAVRGEVHWAEFLGIETLKIFNTGLYSEIKHNKERFVGLLDGNDSSKREEAQKYYDNLISQNPGPQPERTKEFLTTLFPRIHCTYGRFSYSNERTLDWRRQLKVCSSDIFEVYFRLGFSQDYLKNTEMERLLKSSDNSDLFSQAFMEVARAASGTERIDSLLERLLDYTEQSILNSNTKHIVRSMFNIGDQLLQKTALKERSLFDVGTDIRIGRLLYQLLKNCSTNLEIFATLKEASEAGDALSIIIGEIKTVSSKPRSRNAFFPKEEQNLTEQQSQKLISICLNKIREAALNKTLVNCPNLLSIMYRWKEWTDLPGEIESWIKTLVLVPENLKTFLVGITCHSKSQSSGPIKHKYYIRYSTLADFIEPETISDAIQQVLEMKLLEESPSTEIAVKNLLEEIKKPELRSKDTWFDDD